MFTRLLYGGRISLTVGISATLLIVVIGTIVGSIAGYFGGFLDNVLMRLTDFMLSLPFLIFAIAVNSLFIGKASGIWLLVLVVSFLGWGSVARIVRGKILSEKENEYILAAESIGCTPAGIIFRHLLPNVFSTVIVQATLLFATMIVVETGLSFLGFGVPEHVPSWGNMLKSARQPDVLQDKVWMWIPPAAAVTLTILSINFIGEGLKDALNPKSKR